MVWPVYYIFSDFTLQMGTCRCDLHVNVPLPGCIMPTTLLEFIICLYIVMFHANDSSLELASRIQHAHYKNIVGNKYLTNTDLVQKYYHHTKGPKIGGVWRRECYPAMMPNSTGARYLDAPLPQLPHLPHDQVPCDEALLKTKNWRDWWFDTREMGHIWWWYMCFARKDHDSMNITTKREMSVIAELLWIITQSPGGTINQFDPILPIWQFLANCPLGLVNLRFVFTAEAFPKTA